MKETKIAKENKYWLEQLDRIGLFIMGIFIGGVLDATGINNLAVIVSVSCIIPLMVLMYLIKKRK